MKKTKKFDLFENIPLSIKESKIKKSTNTLVSKEFIKYYKERYRGIFGISPKIEWGKDLTLLNSLLKNYQIEDFNCETKLEFLIKACEKYFVIRDPLALKNAWNIGIFYYNFGKIALLLKNSDKEVIDQIIDGYKLAHLNHTGNKFEDSLIGKEEVFSHIYLIIKNFWIQYGEKFNLTRFSEIFFLVLFDYYKNKEKDLNFFTSNLAQNKFQHWLENESKEIFMFLPKGIGQIDENRLELERKLMIEEERNLYNGIN